MRIPLMMIATAISLAMSGQVQAQPVPPQQKNNDASMDGAIRQRGTVDAPAEKAPPIDPNAITPNGSAGPSAGPSNGTTTGSAPPSVTGDAVETETGLGTLMDSDESQVSRNRAPRR